MNLAILSGSPRLLRNINEKAVLELLLRQGASTRMELESFTGLSKPAMSQLLRRLETAGLIRRDGEKAGTYGPKAGLWALEPSACYVAGVAVNAHGLDVAIADVEGRIIAALHESRLPHQRYDAGALLLEALEGAVQLAGLTVSQLDQVAVGLPGIVDGETGHLRKGRQLPNWEGFDIPAALMQALGHRRVLVENDVNLVAIEEAARGAAAGVPAFILLWIGEGVGGGLVLGGKLVRGSTGSAGELGGALVPDRPDGVVRPAMVEDLLSTAALSALMAEHGFASGEPTDNLKQAVGDIERHGPLVEAIAYRIAVSLAGAIGLVDPDMVVLGGEVGVAGGRLLAQHVSAALSRLPIAIPQIVPGGVGDNAVRAGAVELALEYARERVFTGGSAARGLP